MRTRIPALAAAALLLPTLASAAQFSVTVYNLTHGQVITPPVFITHDKNYDLFDLTDSASAALRAMAEGGDTSLIVSEAGSSPHTLDVLASAAGIMPGESATFMLNATPSFPRFSMSGMLAQTNDTFIGVDNYSLERLVDRHDSRQMFLPALDAGTEVNDELMANIPGFGGSGHVDEDGVIVVSSGITGAGDVSSADYTWLNPAALIVFTHLD